MGRPISFHPIVVRIVRLRVKDWSRGKLARCTQHPCLKRLHWPLGASRWHFDRIITPRLTRSCPITEMAPRGGGRLAVRAHACSSDPVSRPPPPFFWQDFQLLLFRCTRSVATSDIQEIKLDIYVQATHTMREHAWEHLALAPGGGFHGGTDRSINRSRGAVAKSEATASKKHICPQPNHVHRSKPPAVVYDDGTPESATGTVER